jgi:hypothetical protein
MRGATKYFKCAAWLVLSLVPTLAMAQSMDIGGGDFQFNPETSERPFAPTSDAFNVKIPGGWDTILNPFDPDTVTFVPQGRAGEASLSVRHFVVPEGAMPRQLISVAIEKQLSKLPWWKTMSRRDVKLAGHAASSVVGTYKYQGNAQYPRIIEQVAVVVGVDAYVFHFEGFEGLAAELQPEVEKFYRSFVPRPSPVGGGGLFDRPDESLVPKPLPF